MQDIWKLLKEEKNLARISVLKSEVESEKNIKVQEYSNAIETD